MALDSNERVVVSQILIVFGPDALLLLDFIV